MNLENICVSLENAKKLKELGVRQESLFFWIKYDENAIPRNSSFEGNFELFVSKYIDTPPIQMTQKIASAFTSDELFDLLPAYIDTKENEPFNNFWLQLQKRSFENIKYIGRYVCDSMSGEEIGNPLYQLESKAKSHSPKLADCLAEMLIYLIENNLFEIKK